MRSLKKIDKILEHWRHQGRQPQGILSYGDVISVDLSLPHPRRFGIWTGRDVILYGIAEGVYRCSLADFKQGGTRFCRYDFPDTYGRPKAQRTSFVSCIPPIDRQVRELIALMRKRMRYHCYTPEETVARAEGQLGKEDVIYPDSEQFAMWCKTGISESHEMEWIKEILGPVIY